MLLYNPGNGFDISYDSSGYGLDDMFNSQQEQGIFLHCIQTSSRAYPTSYAMSQRGCFPRGKVAKA
jgi:hypothetical protein